MTSEDKNFSEISPIFQGEEEIIGRHAYQDGVLSAVELEQLKQGENIGSLIPGFEEPFAVKANGRITVLNGPTRKGEKLFPTVVFIKEPRFAAKALAKIAGNPAYIKARKRRDLHSVNLALR